MSHNKWMSEDNIFTRRQILALFGGATGLAIVAKSQDGSNPATGDLVGGADDMAAPYRVGENTYKGPLSVRSEVPQEDGITFIQTDAGSANDRFAVYHYNSGSWGQRGLDVPALSADDINNIRNVSTSESLVSVFNSLSSGTWLQLEEGTHTADDNLTVPADCVISGYGTGTSVKMADSTDLNSAGLIRITGDNVLLTSFEIDGNKANVTDNGQEYGIFSTAVTNLIVHNLYVHDFPGYGVDPHSEGSTPSEFVHVDSCRIEANGLDGMTFGGVKNSAVTNSYIANNDRHGVNCTDDESQDIRVGGNVCVNNGANGVTVQNGASPCIVSQNICRSNSGKGVKVGNSSQTATGVRLLGNTIKNNGDDGIEMLRSQYCSVLGNSIEGNATSSGNAGISLNVANGVVSRYNVIGFNVIQAGSDYGIDETDSSAGPNIIMGNYVENANYTNINRRHPDTRVVGNIGTSYTTQDTVTITSGSTSATTGNHPHDHLEPEDISVTPRGSLGNASEWWVTGPSSGQYTVNVDSDPGQDVGFSYQIQSGFSA